MRDLNVNVTLKGPTCIAKKKAPFPCTFKHKKGRSHVFFFLKVSLNLFGKSKL